MKHTFPLVLLLLTASTGALAQVQSKGAPKPTGLEAELAKLQADYGKATEAYFAPYRDAKTEADAAKIKLDPTKDPTLAFLPKFKAFAKKAGKSPTAATAWMQVFGMAYQDPKTQDEAFDRIVSDFPDWAKMESLVQAVSYSYMDLGDKRAAKVGACLDRIEKVTKSPSVKAAVLYSRAKLGDESRAGLSTEAKAMLNKVVADYPQTTYAERAKADLFEDEFLSIGKSAPDFTATDENGVSFKLSDYRGKVVVLDFWGFW